MKIDKHITQQLNAVLRQYLTGINQTFLHARMADDWGLERLNSDNYKRSIQLMKEADKLIKRILLLESLPNLQDLGRLRIGQNSLELIQCNLQFELESRAVLVAAIQACEQAHDYVSRDLLDHLLEAAEEQVDVLETHLSVAADLGPQNFNQSQLR